MVDNLIWMCPLKPICNGCCPSSQEKQLECYNKHHHIHPINIFD